MRLVIFFIWLEVACCMNATEFTLSLPWFHDSMNEYSAIIQTELTQYEPSSELKASELYSDLKILDENPYESMYAIACFESNDSTILQMVGIRKRSLFKYFEPGLFGVMFMEGSQKPFFLIATNEMRKKDAEQLFTPKNPITIVWDVAERKEDDYFYGYDTVTSFLYFYLNGQWHTLYRRLNSRKL